MASLDDLASDALAAVEYARAEAMIDEGRIGFWGVSQAGWVAPLAASRSDHVSFMILNSGGGASPRESELFSWRGEFERAGLTVAETADANAVLDAYFGYLATGLDRAGVEARLDSVRQGRLGPLAEALDGVMPSDENRGNWSWVATHDPMPYLEGIDVPVLLMFGDRDTDHPTELSVARWREGLSRAGNEDATIMIFPGAGHGIRLREGYVGQGSAPFAPGYLEVQIGWLLRNVVASNP